MAANILRLLLRRGRIRNDHKPDARRVWQSEGWRCPARLLAARAFHSGHRFCGRASVLAGGLCAAVFFLLIDRNIVLGLCSFAILFLCVCDVPARAQSTVTVTVTVIGPITPGDCAVFNSTTVIKDFGSTGCTGGGGGSPGGSNGQVQFNNAGSFGGLSNVQPSAFVQQPARCRRPAAAQPISRALMGLLQLRQPPRSLASSDGLVLWPPRAATTTRGK
jgi:hypothetical protein